MKKNNMLKKGLCMAASVTMAVSLLSACSPGNADSPATSAEEKTTSAADNGNGETTAGESGEPVELTLFLDNMNITDGSYVKTEIERITNTKLNIIQATPDEMDNKLNIMLASGDIPDIFQCETTTMEGKLLSSGILLPINEYWDEYPNIKSGREEEIWELMKYKDGNVYSIGVDGQNPLQIMAYRQDWLEKFNMEVPETLDEYFEFTKKVAKEDPDENGIDDTFAFGAYQPLLFQWLDHIFGAYGVLPNYWMEVDGRIVDGAVLPGAKDALVFLNKMYSEGLIDPEFVTDDAYRWQSKVKSGIFGAGTTKLQLFDKNNWRNYYQPFIQSNPEGKLVYGPVLKGGCDSPVGERMASRRGWVRTFVYKDSPNVDAALRVIDYLMSEEGNLFIMYGKEGEHYEWEGDKVVRLIDNAKAQELDLEKFYIAQKTLFLHSSDELFDAMEFLKEEGVTTPDPVDGIFIDELSDIYPDLQDLTVTRFVEMIIGEVPVETGFDKFVQEWYAKGGTELEEAINKACKEWK